MLKMILDRAYPLLSRGPSDRTADLHHLSTAMGGILSVAGTVWLLT